MLKAEATTELAPKKASATDPLVAATKSPSEGLGFEVVLSLVKFLRSGGLGLLKREVGRAVVARPSLLTARVSLTVRMSLDTRFLLDSSQRRAVPPMFRNRGIAGALQ